MCNYNNANGFSTRRYSMSLDGQEFPNGDCLQHRPPHCAPWKECIKPEVYRKYGIAGAGMHMEDMVGQCVRAKQKGCFK